MTDSKSGEDKGALDIYLFNNGQESTPPRKYHLRGDQIEWWSLTLTHLAKSQYGDENSEIDLYTVDGQKIEHPLQLKDGTAYVAVLPTDLFIEGGYEQYLLKASRSWEKRQSRKDSIVIIEPGGAIPEESIQTLHQINTSSSNNVNNSVIVKPLSKEDKNAPKSNPRSSFSYLKTSQEKRLSNQPLNTRKLSSSPSPAPHSALKQTFKRKDSGNGRSNVKITSANNRASTTTENTRQLTAKSKLLKPPNKITNPDPMSSLPTVEELKHEFSKTDDMGANQLTHFYNNIKNEATSIYLTPVVVELKETEIEKHNAIEVVARSPEKTDTKERIIMYENDRKSDKSVENIITSLTEPIPKVPAILVQSVINQPETAPRKLEDTDGHKKDNVNVNLNIEIWNQGNSATFKMKNSNKNDTLKSEKASQPNIHDIHEFIEIDDSTQKELENELKDKNSKVMVMKCSCVCRCGDDGKNESDASKNNSKELFIFLPILHVDPGMSRCDCNMSDCHGTLKSRQSKMSSFAIPIRKLNSCTSLINMMSVHETAQNGESTITQARTTPTNNRPIDITESTSKKRSVAIYKEQVSAVIVNDAPTPNPVNAAAAANAVAVTNAAIAPRNANLMTDANRGTATNDMAATNFVTTGNCVTVVDAVTASNHVSPKVSSATAIAVASATVGSTTVTAVASSESPIERHNDTKRSDFKIIKKESSYGLKVNKSTQTGWNNMLLEVKLEDDGHYSFHLPKLDMLKKYNKLYTE